jgi:uncharacterized RDD family membrane protein YckC
LCGVTTLRITVAMVDREPALLTHDGPIARSPAAATTPRPAPANDARSVIVAGFWRRLLAALIDLAIIVPAGLILAFVAAKIAGVSPRDSDMLLLVLGADPALILALGMVIAVGAVYALVFHILRGQTVGMRVLGLRVIDVYGDRPAPSRCVVRTLGYIAGALTLFLGFIWIGFDSEKRGLHDWIAGTYVIRG